MFLSVYLGNLRWPDNPERKHRLWWNCPTRTRTLLAYYTLLTYITRNPETLIPFTAIQQIGGIDITCLRNAFGRQNQSHVTELDLSNEALRNAIGTTDDVSGRFSGVFIRAPVIKTIDSQDVQVLCVHPAIKSGNGDNSGITNVEREQPAGVRQGNKIACSFHPELTDDCRWHAYFLLELLKTKFGETS